MDTEVAAEILRERCGVTGPVTVHETWGASVVVEIDGLFLKANGDRSTTAEALVAQRVRAAAYPRRRSGPSESFTCMWSSSSPLSKVLLINQACVEGDRFPRTLVDGVVARDVEGSHIGTGGSGGCDPWFHSRPLVVAGLLDLGGVSAGAEPVRKRRARGSR